LRIVFMGTPGFAIPSLAHLVLNHHQVTAVYTQPDRPAGRGQSLAPSPLKQAALAMQLPVRQPASLKDTEALEQLAELKPDVIVVTAYGKMLPRPVLDLPRYGCLNLHPSLLPRYRGASPVVAAILAGEEFTGVSVMLLDEGVDTGPVISQAAVSISPRDNTGSLMGKLAQVAARLFIETLVHWSRGAIAPQPQNESEASYCATVVKSDGEIDWGMAAADIWRRVRAFNPWPGSYTRWQGKQLKIIEAVPLCAVRKSPGQVLPEESSMIGVGTGDGVLGVLRVQLEGRRAMSAAEFLRGHRDIVGAVLPS